MVRWRMTLTRGYDGWPGRSRRVATGRTPGGSGAAGTGGATTWLPSLYSCPGARPGVDWRPPRRPGGVTGGRAAAPTVTLCRRIGCRQNPTGPAEAIDHEAGGVVAGVSVGEVGRGGAPPGAEDEAADQTPDDDSAHRQPACRTRARRLREASQQRAAMPWRRRPHTIPVGIDSGLTNQTTLHQFARSSSVTSRCSRLASGCHESSGRGDNTPPEALRRTGQPALRESGAGRPPPSDRFRRCQRKSEGEHAARPRAAPSSRHRLGMSERSRPSGSDSQL